MGGKVLHGTPGMAKRHSVRMSRHEVWPEGQTRASESPLTWRTDERAMKGRGPKTPSRPSPCGATNAAQSNPVSVETKNWGSSKASVGNQKTFTLSRTYLTDGISRELYPPDFPCIFE